MIRPSDPDPPGSGGVPLNLLLQTMHLVLKAQLQLLQPHFLHFFVFGEVSLLGEGFQPLGVLRVLLNQSLELIMTGQELLSWSQHPCQTSCCFVTTKLQTSTGMGQVQWDFQADFHRSRRPVETKIAPETVQNVYFRQVTRRSAVEPEDV